MHVQPLTDRQLDVKIAEALGWTKLIHPSNSTNAPLGITGLPPGKRRYNDRTHIPGFSTDPREMLELLHNSLKMGGNITIESSERGLWRVSYHVPKQPGVAVWTGHISGSSLPRLVAEAWLAMYEESAIGD
jgi:hypothetical protein